MSDYIIDGNVLNLFSGLSSNGVQTFVEYFPDTDNFRIRQQAYLGKYDEELVEIDQYVSGRYIDILLEFMSSHHPRQCDVDTPHECCLT